MNQIFLDRLNEILNDYKDSLSYIIESDLDEFTEHNVYEMERRLSNFEKLLIQTTQETK